MDLTGVNKLSTPNVGKANLSVRWGWHKGVPLRKMHKFHLVEGLWVPLFVPVGATNLGRALPAALQRLRPQLYE